MKMTRETYAKTAEKRAAKSPLFKNACLAFLVGGTLCAAAEGIILWARSTGVEAADARLCGSLSLIAVSILLTALNVYDNLAKHAGAGMLVPITGFANAMVSPAIEFKAEGLVLGLGVKLFSIAGPVLAYGIGASVLYGLILQLIAVIGG